MDILARERVTNASPSNILSVVGTRYDETQAKRASSGIAPPPHSKKYANTQQGVGQ
jgi:hypothetical protein